MDRKESKKVRCQVQLRGDSGLHIRPASRIAALLKDSRSSVFFTYQGQTVDAKSMMNLLSLQVGAHAPITIEIEGVDAEEVYGSLIAVFENGLGE